MLLLDLKESEYEKMDSSLTTPSDRKDKNYIPNMNIPPLTKQETDNAVNNLVNKLTYPNIERRYIDPFIDQQKFCLISFVPSEKAVPDKDGFFGFMKVRGSFNTEEEAVQYSESLIRNVDSYHKIYISHVGRPFPITNKSDYSKEITDIDLKKKIEDNISADVKKKREQEAKEIEEVKSREKELLEDVKKEESDEDRYTTLKVKKAQLTWTFLETESKVKQIVDSIARAQKELEDFDKNSPKLKEMYFERYKNARKESGLPVDPESTDKSFVRYMVEDVDIPEVRDRYNELFLE